MLIAYFKLNLSKMLLWFLPMKGLSKGETLGPVLNRLCGTSACTEIRKVNYAKKCHLDVQKPASCQGAAETTCGKLDKKT